MVFQFLKILEMPAAIRANQKLSNLNIHTLQQLFMYHLEDLVLHQVWQVVPVRITKWKGCHIHGPGRCTKEIFLQLGSLSGVARSFVILNTYIYFGGAGCLPHARGELPSKSALTIRERSCLLGSIVGITFSADFGSYPTADRQAWRSAVG